MTLTGAVSVEEWGQTSQGQKMREVEVAKYRQHIGKMLLHTGEKQ